MAEERSEDTTEATAEVTYSSKLNWKIAVPVAIAALLLLGISLLPLAIEYAAEKWLQEHGVPQAEIENVDLNLFSGAFVLQGLKAGDGLDVKRLALNIDWLPLFKQIVHLRSFELDSANLTLHQNEQQQWQLADIKLEPSTAESEKSETSRSESQDKLWLVVVDDLQINALLLHVNGNEMQLKLPVDALQLNISEVMGSEQTLSSELKLGEIDFSGFGYQVNNQSLDLTAKLLFSMYAEDIAASLKSEDAELKLAGLKLAQQDGKALAEVESIALNNLQMAGINRHKLESVNIGNVTMQPQLTGAGSLQFSAIDVQKIDADLQGQIGFASLILTGLQADGMSGNDDRMQLQRIELAGLSMQLGKTVNLQSLVMQGFDLKQKQGKQLLSAIDTIALNNFAMTSTDNGTFDSLTLSKIKLPAVGKKSLGSIGAIVATGATLDVNGAYQLKKLQFDAFDVTLIKQKNGQFVVLDELAGEQKPKKKTEAVAKPIAKKVEKIETAQKSSDAVVIVDELLIRKGSKIKYRDESVSPPLDIPMRLKRFRFSPLDMSGKRDGILDMVLEIGKYGQLTAKGKVRPNAAKLKTDLVISLKNFDLTGLSGFVEADFGKSISTGEFNLDSDINIAGNRIQAKNRMLVHKLKLGAPSDPDAKVKSPGLPIDMALSLIQDKQGNINLQVPVEGALDNPDVGMRIIFNQALESSISSGAIANAAKILKPYGTIIPKANVADGSVRNGKAKLTPIVYDERATGLSPKMADYVSKIAQLLKQNDFRLQVCGAATLLEGEAVSAKASKESGEAKPIRLAMPDAKVLELAGFRADSVVEKLKGHGVESDRVSKCPPLLDEKKNRAYPRVELILD